MCCHRSFRPGSLALLSPSFEIPHRRPEIDWPDIRLTIGLPVDGHQQWTATGFLATTVMRRRSARPAARYCRVKDTISSSSCKLPVKKHDPFSTNVNKDFTNQARTMLPSCRCRITQVSWYVQYSRTFTHKPPALALPISYVLLVVLIPFPPPAPHFLMSSYPFSVDIRRPSRSGKPTPKAAFPPLLSFCPLWGSVIDFGCRSSSGSEIS